MFSGIVETMAQVVKIETEQTNKHFTLRNPFGEPLTIDQSIAHNGVCLTVVKMEGDLYTVTAMQETLRLTNLDSLKEGDWVNVERSMLMGGRLAEMIERGYFCVDKGSVTINGVSLTVCEPDIQGNKGYVSVCIIPYTHENTNFKYIEVGTIVNMEFDILGKYLSRYAAILKDMKQ